MRLGAYGLHPEALWAVIGKAPPCMETCMLPETRLPRADALPSSAAGNMLGDFGGSFAEANGGLAKAKPALEAHWPIW